jgi:hypothetical protein
MNTSLDTLLARCVAVTAVCLTVGCATVEPPPPQNPRVVERELAPPIDRIAERLPSSRPSR